MKPVVFMTPTFFIVGLDELKTKINLIRLYLEGKGEPLSSDITDGVLKEDEANFENNVRYVDSVMNLTSSVLKAFDPRTYFNGNKDIISENVQGEYFDVLRANPLGVRQKRVYLLTESYVIRLNPETKERRSVREYSDIVKINVSGDRVNIQYVDGVDVLFLKKTDIPRLLAIVKQKLPELEVE